METTRRSGTVLYLDFDGVLHHENVNFNPKRGIYLGAPGCTFFEWMPILERLLAPHPRVQIVLATAWVQRRSFAFAKKQLSPALQARVIGATYHQRGMREDEFLNLSRGAQIANDVYRRSPASWFALDDDDIGWPEGYRSHLIRTDGRLGISDPAIQEAVRVRLELPKPGRET
jgi:hypothetical protein